MLELPYSAHIACDELSSDKVSFLLNCTCGGVLCSCYDKFLGWWYLWWVPLMHSEVVGLCDGKPDVKLC